MNGNDRREARVTGSDIIEEILRNMEESLEPMKYSILAHGVYRVALHPQDFERLQGVFPRIRDEAYRALEERLARLNRRPLLPIPIGREPLRHESATGSWEVNFAPDPEGELGPGDIVVESELAYPIESGRGAGTPTKRIVTRRGQPGAQKNVGEGARFHDGGRTHPSEFNDTEPLIPIPGHEAGRVLARLLYEDGAGRHCFEMVKDQIVIGRGGSAHWCDLQLDASHDVSREHARLRHEPETGRFFLKDMSLLGTTIDGREVPRSVEETSQGKVDRNVEVELPRVAQIGLAGVLFLRFESHEPAPGHRTA